MGRESKGLPGDFLDECSDQSPGGLMALQLFEHRDLDQYGDTGSAGGFGGVSDFAAEGVREEAHTSGHQHQPVFLFLRSCNHDIVWK